MESFYVTLPVKFPKEANAYWTTQFGKNINLPGSWEVGLSEISYSKTWFNINLIQKVHLLYFDPLSNNGISTSTIDDGIIPRNFYTKESLIETINNVIKLHFDKRKILIKNKNIQMHTLPEIKFDTNTDSFALLPGKTHNFEYGYIYIIPDEEICHVIGHDYKEIKQEVNNLFENFY